MTVSNGQLANDTTFNSSFVSREVDTDTVGKFDLKNIDSLSGANLLNVQRIINSIASALGITTSEVYDFLITWGADYVGNPNDTVRARINALVAKFAGAGLGHKHTDVDGDAAAISATDLIDINQLFAEWQSFTAPGVTGGSTDVTSFFSGRAPGGSAIAEGVITTVPNNKCVLINPTTGDQFEDGEGQKVYGRLTWSASIWTLTYYTNEAGVESGYSFGSSTDVQFFFLEVFNLANRPTIPSTPEFGSLDITGDVVDASPTQRGVVNTAAQSFAGIKQFNSGVTIDSLIQLLITTDSSTTGSAQTVDGTADPVVILTNASLTSVAGFTSDVKSRYLIVINKTGSSLTLLHDDSGASANNRILLPNGVNQTWRDQQGFAFVYDTTNSRWVMAAGGGSPFQLVTFGSTPNANGASYNTSTGDFNIQPADQTNPGAVSIAQQRFLGLKGFDSGFGTLISVDNTSTGADVTLTRTQGYYKFTDSGLLSITMITAPTQISAVLYLTNGTGNAVVIKNENGGTAANRIITGTGSDLTWDDGQTISLIYDVDSSRWRIASGSGGGGVLVFGSRGTPRSVDPSVGITSGAGHMNTSSPDQIIFVEANASGIQTMTANPQIQAGTVVGQKIRLVGRSSADVLRMVNGLGVACNGSIDFNENTVWDGFWDGTEWVEVSRNV